jgi:chromosome segregation protein
VRLKRLELYGFKTFADKTTLEFGEGITAIVGSNGVGKSNICDAMLWVLGEQSMRSLRSQSALDVIFNGTNGRKPINFAEVSLTLDNSDGALPVDFTEVTIARRVFRTGESEYAINKSKCRLKDITDLFLDTGIGRAAYSFITQGEIDAVLSIRSEDRRELIEEVAGIQKYRQRRKEASRKLDATEKNVTRVGDIISELARQRAELEGDAERAAKYRDLSSRLRALELDLLVIDYERRSKRVGRLANDLEIAHSEAEALNTQITKLEAEEESLRLDLARVQEQLETRRQEAVAAQREADAEESAQAVARERHRALVERREAIETTSGARSETLRQAKQRLTEAREQAAGLEEDLRVADSKEAQQAAVVAEARRRLLDAQGDAQRRREKLAQLRAMAAGREQGLRTYQAVIKDMEQRLKRLTTDIEAHGKQQAQARQAANESAERLRSLGEELKRAEARREAARAVAEKLRASLEQDDAALKDLERDVSAHSSRLAVLRELQEGREECGEGIRRVAAAYRNGLLPGLRGVVGEVLDVPEQYERAVEMALGPQLEWIIVNTQADAERGIQLMREGEPSRATFIPIAAMGALATPVSAMLAGDDPDVLGPASRLVGFPRALRRVFDYLLGDTVIVANLEAAFRLKKRLGVAAKVVTLDGEMVDRCGAITVGARPTSAASILRRKRDIEQLSAQISDLRDALEAARGVVARRQDEVRRAEAELEAATAALADVRFSLLEARKEHAYAEKDMAALTDSLAALTSEKSSLEAELRETRRKAGERLTSSEDASKEERQLAAAVAEIERALERLAAEADEATEALASMRVAHAAARERMHSAQEAARQAEREIAQLVAQDERDAGELADLTDEIAALEAALSQPRDSGESARARLQALEQTVVELTGTRNQLQERISAVTDELRALRAALSEAQERARRAEISLTREQAELEHVVQRLAEGFELSPDQAMQQRDPEAKDHEIAREARAIQAEIRALGPVNVGAVEEYERLQRREEFLRAQKDDLDAAREDLLRVINEADEASRNAFLEAFDAVEREFQAIFTDLFGGGTAELMLTRPENLVETGVEVIVQPPGRKQQNLLVLSGGERALTAAALIFAMIRVRPSPFCVIDELDAPLDESNIRKYNALLREFAEHSQLIVITHNPETMTLADRYLGVTMQEPGVSRVLTLSMKRIEGQLEEASQC